MIPHEGTSTSAVDAEHEARVSAFRNDLVSHEIRDVVRKHITTGDPVAIDRETYFELRRRVGREYSLHPSAVVLVGSCRLGFTLKEKGKNRRRYLPIQASSDVDVAVVSTVLFDAYWDTIFDLIYPNRDWTMNNGEGKKFARDLFCGWLTPNELPNLPRFEHARKWAEFFAQLTAARVCGYREIKGRLYRSWERLEAYQAIMVSRCRDDLKRRKS